MRRQACVEFTGSDAGVCFVGEHAARGKHFHLLIVGGGSEVASYYHGFWRKLSAKQWVEVPRYRATPTRLFDVGACIKRAGNLR